MRIRYARPLRRSQKLRCPLCLFEFRAGEALVRCERGCTAKDTAESDTPLIFHQSESPKRGASLRWTITSAQCPGCLRPSACWVCPACRADLPLDGLGDSVLPLVVLGGRSAGKSTLVTTMLEMLEADVGPARGLVLDPWDDRTRDAYARARADVETRESLPHANDTSRLRPWVFRLSEAVKGASRSRWLSVFDPPGGPWEDRDEEFLNSANFVTSAQSIILVLDPTRCGAVNTALQRAGGFQNSSLPGMKGEPYTWRRVSAVEEIRHLATFFGRRGLPVPSPARLAIVLTKFEVWGSVAPAGTLTHHLASAPAPAGLTEADVARTLNDEAEALLCEWNGETFAQQVDQKFPNTRYFIVSSLGEAAGAPPGRRVKPFGFGVKRLVEWGVSA